MVEQYTAPVNHSAGSAVASTAAGAAKGGFSGAMKGIGIIVGVGAFIGLAISLVATGVVALPTFVGAATLSGAMGNAAIIAGSTILGGGLALFGAPLAATIGGLIGGFKGGSKAVDNVHKERGAAAAVQAQIDMVRAQNPVVQGTTIYAPTATNDNTFAQHSFAAQNAPMNSIQGSSIQYDGLTANQQLVAAR